jgi:glycerate 2-kinase
MVVRARELGYTAKIQETCLEGEARDVAKEIASKLHDAEERTVWLYGGETTVTVSGPGKGGRNEEFALGALLELSDDELYVSLASDGRDNTDFAGGIADVVTKKLAQEQGLDPKDYLYTNDSYSFFHTLRQGVTTGYTGCNVADLVIAMKHGEH